MITPAGGRIDAQAADGTRYALIVPPGAVGSDVEVVMTPLGGAQNLPFEGLGAGVKLEPAGLDLDQPAKLLIQRDGLTISDGTAAFGSSDGRDLFLTPWTGVGPGESLGPGTIALPVGHFSGWGVVSLTEIQLGAQYARSAFQASDRITQEIREAIRQSVDGSFADGEIPVDRLRDEIVKPLLEAAARDPIWLDDAIDAYLTLDRQVALLVGERAIDDPAVEKLLAKALKRYSKALRDRCNSADFAALGQAMVHARQAEFLIPYLGFGPAAQALAEARDLLADCLRFELRMQSREDFQFEYTFGSTVAAVVPLAGEALDGAGPIGYIDASYVDGADCSSSVPSTQGSTMVVDGGADLLRLAPSLPGKPAETKPRVSFSVDPGTPQELVRVQCPDEPPQEVETAFWVTLWAGCTHRGPADAGFVRTIDGFEPTGTAGILATRTYRGTYECPDDLAPVRVDETWEFAHTPAVG